MEFQTEIAEKQKARLPNSIRYLGHLLSSRQVAEFIYAYDITIKSVPHFENYFSIVH